MALADSDVPNQHRKARLTVLLIETRCALRTIRLLARNRIALPRENVGRRLMFANGTHSEVYRETAIRSRNYEGLVLIVVRFRLRLIGSNRLAHWLFRVESLLNTLLFAAHPGFETKLWLTDRETGYYRGIYEWRGRTEAIEYAETLRVVLRPWVEQGSFAYQVIEGHSRVDFLNGQLVDGDERPGHGWWRVAPSSMRATQSDGTR
jgi:hypothetical protein